MPHTPFCVWNGRWGQLQWNRYIIRYKPESVRVHRGTLQENPFWGKKLAPRGCAKTTKKWKETKGRLACLREEVFWLANLARQGWLSMAPKEMAYSPENLAYHFRSGEIRSSVIFPTVLRQLYFGKPKWLYFACPKPDLSLQSRLNPWKFRTGWSCRLFGQCWFRLYAET